MIAALLSVRVVFLYIYTTTNFYTKSYLTLLTFLLESIEVEKIFNSMESSYSTQPCFLIYTSQYSNDVYITYATIQEA